MNTLKVCVVGATSLILMSALREAGIEVVEVEERGYPIIPIDCRADYVCERELLPAPPKKLGRNMPPRVPRRIRCGKSRK